MQKISKEEARLLLINYQLLNGSVQSRGKKAVLEVFDRIKTIQYDPLNVVGRNPDLLLQARLKNYKSEYLNNLLYRERTLVDGWDKMMSIYRTEDWPYFQHLRQIKKDSVRGVLAYRESTGALDLIDEVLDILRESGPMLSTKMDLGSLPKGSWGHGKAAGAALDYLFHIGRVGVSSKRGTQKVYDVIENLLPGDLIQRHPFNNSDDFYKWLLLRRIQSIGLFWNNNSIVWDGIDKKFKNKSFRDNIFKALLEENAIEEIFIEGIPQPLYILKNNPLLEENKYDNKIRLLAPLDNILWDRNFISELFHFEYRWEVYTPISKRKYGYYILPLLYKGRFIGRIEPVFERAEKKLRIKNIWFEKNITINKTKKEILRRAILKFSKYLNAQAIEDETDLRIGL